MCKNIYDDPIASKQKIFHIFRTFAVVPRSVYSPVPLRRRNKMPDLAIDGGPKAVAASMNDSWQDVSDQERQYVNQVLDNQDDAYAQLDLFDEAYRAFVGSKHALCMCNGTAALHSAIFAAGACAGKEVIAPTATWQVYGAGRADVRRRDSPSRKGRGYVAVPSLPVASFQRRSNSPRAPGVHRLVPRSNCAARQWGSV